LKQARTLEFLGFDVDFNAHFVSDSRRTRSHPKIGALNLASSRPTRDLDTFHPRAKAKAFDTENNYFGDTMQCEIACDFVIGVTKLLPTFTLEDHLWEFFDVKIIGCTQMLVPVALIRVDAAGVDCGLNLALLGGFVVKLNGTRELIESAGNIRKEMTDAKLN